MTTNAVFAYRSKPSFQVKPAMRKVIIAMPEMLMKLPKECCDIKGGYIGEPCC
jgi:hypothetical protein